MGGGCVMQFSRTFTVLGVFGLGVEQQLLKQPVNASSSSGHNELLKPSIKFLGTLLLCIALISDVRELRCEAREIDVEGVSTCFLFSSAALCGESFKERDGDSAGHCDHGDGETDDFH